MISWRSSRSNSGLPGVVANLPAADKQIVIVPADNLSTIRNVVSWLRALSTWTIFIGLALFAAAVWLAGDRRRAVFWSAMSLSPWRCCW